MFAAATIGEWRGHDVGDAQGHKIGGLEAVYVDTRTGLPSSGTVKAGTPARHRLVLVPVDRATAGLGYLKVCYGRKQAKMPRRAAPAASCQRPVKRRSLSTTAWHASRAPAVSGSWPAAQQPKWAEDQMIALFLLLVIVAIVLGIVGVVAKGLLYLLFIGIVVFLGALVLGALRMRRRPGKHPDR
jgi:hypothetical protein